MKDAIDRACERFGVINGVIHAVTSPGAGLIQLKTVEMAEHVLAPVAKGAQIVGSLLAGAALDFFACFSSTTSIIPGLGQVDSCAASAFLDALATSISLEQGIHAVSIDWSLWHADTSQEALVASVPEMQLQMRQARESYGIKTEEGIEAVCRVLSCNVPHVVVCTQDFKAVTELQNALTARSLLDDLGAIQKAKQKYPRPDAGGAFIAPRNAIEQTVAETWQELFNIESISMHDDFFELGGHSLLALQLVSRLRAAFQMEMQLSSIFETPTVAGLAGTIAEKRMGADEIDEINSLLEAIEGMTPDQVQARIERELRGSRESETNR
jgi:acyl carrier protein